MDQKTANARTDAEGDHTNSGRTEEYGTPGATLKQGIPATIESPGEESDYEGEPGESRRILESASLERRWHG